jgi:segregation and condensation protein B
MKNGEMSNESPSGQHLDVSLGLDDFVEPDDQGLSLDELSQAYAALLTRGADPYADSSSAVSAVGLGDIQHETSNLPKSDGAESEPDQTGREVTPQSILEAILFVGHPTGEPLTSERIAALMRGVRPAEIDDLVQDLNAGYTAAGAAYAIFSIGAGYKMGPRPEFAGLRDAFYGRIREARLSQAAIDVLAIVGYHQPVAAEEIDRLRGKPSAAILGQLVRRDLLQIQIQRLPGGKGTAKYSTTGRFLALFGLDDTTQLPRSHDFERQ